MSSEGAMLRSRCRHILLLETGHEVNVQYLKVETILAVFIGWM